MARVDKRGFHPVPDSGLFEDIAQMGLDGLGAEEKSPGNFFVGHAFADESQNLNFPGGNGFHFCQ